MNTYTITYQVRSTDHLDLSDLLDAAHDASGDLLAAIESYGHEEGVTIDEFRTSAREAAPASHD